MLEITDDDLDDYEAYERVRNVGKWNMFDPRARRATRLSESRYSFVLKNYDELRAAHERERAGDISEREDDDDDSDI